MPRYDNFSAEELEKIKRFIETRCASLWRSIGLGSWRSYRRGRYSSPMDCCNHCKQPLIEIDNRGQRLTGCLTCNLWTPVDGKRWTRLSEEGLRAVHHLRHGGTTRTARE
jgi:hypothetical protein